MYRKRIGENKGISLILSTKDSGGMSADEGIEDQFVPEATSSSTLLLIVDVMEVGYSN